MTARPPLLNVGIFKGRAPAVLMSHSVSVAHRPQPASQSLDGLSAHRVKDPVLRVSESGSPGWGLRICVSAKSPGDVEVAGPDTTL